MSPRRTIRTTPARLLVAVLALTAGLIAAATPAYATVSISRAEVDRGNLRIEGRAAANRTITVDGVAMATSDGSGSFRVSRSSYVPPADCTVDVNDGSTTPTAVRLTGCTVSTPPPTSSPTILPDTATIGPGDVGLDFPSSTSAIVNFSGAVGPVGWEVVAGALPNGLAVVVPEPAGRPRPPSELTYMQIEGTPTTVQTSTFTLRATDVNGLTATRTYSITINPAVDLAIAPDPWPLLYVGEFANLRLRGSGGVLPYRWAVAQGALPTGMTLIQDDPNGTLVRVGGTPTTAGTYSWTLRLTDAQATTITRTFSATVEPAPAALAAVSVVPTSVTGGSSATGTVSLTAPAPAGGAVVSLASSNPQAAAVPASVTVPAGSTGATFAVSTTAVSVTTSVTISGNFAGITRATTVTVAAPSTSTDTVSVTRAEYDSGKRVLRVEAASSSAGATLRVYVTATNALIGTLSGGAGSFSLASSPQSITVRSSLGGSATRTVTVK